jgi:hypothetical protein
MTALSSISSVLKVLNSSMAMFITKNEVDDVYLPDQY